MEFETVKTIKDLSDNEIGEGYLTESGVRTTMNDSDYIWHIAKTTDSGIGIQHVEDTTTEVQGDIIGFIRGKQQSARTYRREKPYAEDVFNTTQVTEDMFPMFEILTGVVDTEYQGQGVGTRLFYQLVKHVSEELSVNHGIGRMWDKTGQSNDHIDAVKTQAGAVELFRVTEYMPHVTCEICGENRCACNGVVLFYPEKSWEETLLGW